MKYTLIILSFIAFTSCYAQQNRSIAFYNIENLFDTIDGPNDDAEFLPNGKNKWTSDRYLTKLKRINEVIDVMQNPILIGLCEIENKNVVEDLFRASSKRSTYEIIHSESEDARGIDVAMAYDPSVLSLKKTGIIRFKLDNPEHPYTRDILWSKFVYGRDTVVAMVNHWPSRSGGQVESEPNRLKASAQATEFIDSLVLESPKTMIVFMGDLNDYPTNMSAQLVAERLTPMISKASGKFEGTYNYRGEWDVLDHIMVSKNFFKGKNVKVVKKSGKILSPDFIITDFKGDLVPKRNYGGANYLDGYSDHLPVLIEVKVK